MSCCVSCYPWCSCCVADQFSKFDIDNTLNHDKQWKFGLLTLNNPFGDVWFYLFTISLILVIILIVILIRSKIKTKYKHYVHKLSHHDPNEEENEDLQPNQKI